MHNFLINQKRHILKILIDLPLRFIINIMNKSLLFLIAILLLNCTTKPNHEEIAISKVKETILDSNSFELVKLEKDTTLLSEILLFQHHSYQRLSKECEEMANLAFRDLASLREQKPANFQKYEEIVLKAANPLALTLSLIKALNLAFPACRQAGF